MVRSPQAAKHPRRSGIIIAAVGTGWAFLLNGASFIAVLISLALLRIVERHPHPGAIRTRASFTRGLRYAWSRRNLKAILIMLFPIGTCGLNVPIFISTMAVSVFYAEARGYGLLSSIAAIGTISGALLSAGRKRPASETMLAGATVFGVETTSST